MNKRLSPEKHEVSEKDISTFLRTCFFFYPGNTVNWLDSLSFKFSQDKKILTIYYPHSYFREWFERKIKTELETVLIKKFNFIRKIVYNTLFTNKNIIDFIYNIDNAYSFDNFLYNKKNYLPYITALEISCSDHIIINPFIILGEKGSGKTHLVKSLANNFLKKNIYKYILYTNIDNINFLYQSYFKDIDKFRLFFKNYEVIILEDLHLLPKYDSLQRGLIPVIDDLISNSRQIIFTGNNLDNLFSLMQSKLSVRLENDFIVQLKRPDLDIRLHYLQNRLKSLDIEIDKRDLINLAKQLIDFKSLQGIITQLQMDQSNLDNEKNILFIQDVIQKKGNNKDLFLNLNKIINEVSDYFEISRLELLSSNRRKKITLARQVAMYLSRSILGYSYPEIGSFFGGRDHSTVLHSVKKIDQLKENKREIRIMLYYIQEKCFDNQS